LSIGFRQTGIIPDPFFMIHNVGGKFVGQTGVPVLLGILLPVIKLPGVFMTSGILAVATGAYAYLIER